ncbi:hypothetical protein BDV11DRAFT_209812 [Aspergillus similis]
MSRTNNPGTERPGMFSCPPLTTQLSEPIVSPGRQSHTHVITGGTAFQRRTMGIQTARDTRETTCEAALSRSNYWVPALYHKTDTGSLRWLVYYLNQACSYVTAAWACPDGAHPLATPADLRFWARLTAYWTYNDSEFAQRAISYVCIEKNGMSNETEHLPRQPCEKLRSQNLDSLDHKSHVAYPASGDYNKGACPESHPVAIFSIFVEFVFNTGPSLNYQNLLYATGDRIGYGLHGELHLQGGKMVAGPGMLDHKNSYQTVAALSLKPEVPILWAGLGQNRTISVLPGHSKHAY